MSMKEMRNLSSSTPTPLLDIISPASWNLTGRHLEDLPLDSSFAWLLFALLMGIVWLNYIAFYNSRVFGYLLTKIINRFVKYGYVKIGSVSLSVLSGTIMYRDVSYIKEDYSVRIQDGWMKFRWWYKYIKKDDTEDFSHSDPRLSFLFNGFEWHIYNRSSAYSRLEKLFGLTPQVFPEYFDEEEQDKEPEEDAENNSSDQNLATNENNWWRDFISVIKCDISSGRIVFGNRLLPTTLLITTEDAHLVYTTKLPFSRIDKFRHTLNCRAENFKIILANSPKYCGIEDEPPRFMGEGFVVLQSNCVDLYYYLDEPGVIPDQPELIELADGKIVEASTSPAWGLDIKCGKGTDFSYGPWADRQREHLFNFFFPQDYQALKVTQKAKPGEKRQFKTFDIRLSILYDSTIDTLFSKDKVTNAVHMNVKQGSYLEITIPWIITENGYTTRINGQLFHVDASTSHTYRSLFETETLEFDVTAKYPLIWNDPQKWIVNITGCKASVNLIYEHKSFFQNLLSDWSSRYKPDILRFIPYLVDVSVILKEYEIVLLSNEHNWIDCSSQHQENAHMAFCGEVFEMSINMPFYDFLPPLVPIKIWIQGECVNLAMYLPESNTYRNVVLALDRNIKLVKRDGTISNKQDNDKRWRNKAQKNLGWIDCWTVPIIALSINYSYYPIPPLILSNCDENFTTPEKEEKLLNPIRPPTAEGDSTLTLQKLRPHAFDPTTLPPDSVNVELEVGSSVVYLYGSVLRNFMHIKENYFGTDQRFTDSSGLPNTKTGDSHLLEDLPAESFDPRQYRPLEVIVSITMHDIQGYAMKNSEEDDSPCPSAYLEKLVFELHKTYAETKLQLLVSPVVLSTVDVIPRRPDQLHLSNGFIALSGLQVRGHAMFSDEGVHLDDETLEYAWLTEIKLGCISGRLTTPQLSDIVECIDTFLFLVENAENTLHSPSLYKKCHHGHGQLHCIDRSPDQLCPTSDDIKYKMTRFSMEQVDLFLVETNVALNLSIMPAKLTFCNLHGHQTECGMTAMFSSLRFKQYIMNNSNNETNGEIWLEVGSVILEKIYFDSIKAQSQPLIHERQNSFLRCHDSRSKRLWFLWPPNLCTLPRELIGKCGCRGACAFFTPSQNDGNYFHVVNPNDHQLLVNSNSAIIYAGSSKTSPYDGCVELSPVVDSDALKSKLSTGSVHTIGTYRCTDNSGSRSKEPFQVIPLVQRTLSHREPGTTPENDNGLEPTPSVSSIGRFISVNETSSQISSFNRHNIQANSVSSLQESNNKNNDSPIKINRSTSRHSIANRPRSGIVRAISVGRSSITSTASLDIYFPAEDDIEGKEKPLLSRDHKEEWLNGSTNSLLQGQIGALNQDEKESNSISSTSFISAVSSQEDLALVDLHVQLDKPITESPLLMAAYNSHSTRLKCANWKKFPTLYPNPTKDGESSKTFYVTDYVPYFHPISEGFTAIKLIDKDNVLGNVRNAGNAEIKEDNWDFPQKLHDKYEDNDDLDNDLFYCEDSVSKATIVIKIEGDFDIHISPLMLEATQSFLEALSPCLSKLHPFTIISKLHSQCVADVQAANQLKKEKYLYISHLNQLRRANKMIGKEASSDNVYEETRTSQIQTFITLKKLNINVFQASISEELTSFAALENILDVTCVSLFMISLSDLECKVYSSTQSRKTIQSLEVSDVPVIQRKKSSAGKDKKSKLDWHPPEQNPIETSETQEEELMISFDVSRVHTQFRRLRNNGTTLKDAVLTIISKEQSKVFFTCDVDIPASLLVNKNSIINQAQPSGSSKAENNSTNDIASKFADQLGFIMSECGVECLQLKLTKRIGLKTSTLDEIKSNGAKDLGSNQGGPTTRSSFESLSSGENPGSSLTTNSNGDISSVVLDIKSFWFNFAAPPYSPKAEKPIYTRHDWHLLSTATPAINSWLNPTNRLLVVIQKLGSETAHRKLAVIACLMAEALDIPSLHRPNVWKHNVLTPLAKTLQEDPSCQLLTVLQRYLNTASLASLNGILSESSPDLETIHKGLVALSRQWKNILYMPSVVERNIKLQKNQKPFRVSFAVPIRDPAYKFSHPFKSTKERSVEQQVPESSVVQTQVEIDERSSDESGSQTSSDCNFPGTDGDSGMNNFKNGSNFLDRKKRLPCYKPRSSSASVVLPLMPSHQSDSYSKHSTGLTTMTSKLQFVETRKSGINKNMMMGDSNMSLNSTTPSAASAEGGEVPNFVSPSRNHSAKKRSPSHDLDLYAWMVKQQDYAAVATDDLCDDMLDNPDPRVNTMGSDDTKTSGSQSDFHQSSAFSLGPIAAQIADTHVIFYPLLTGLQVPSQVAGSIFSQRFGTNLTVKAVLELFKIDMVESCSISTYSQKSGRPFIRPSKSPLSPQDTSAFKCEKLIVDSYFKEGQEIEKMNDVSDKNVQTTMLIYGGADNFRKHTTITVNFCVNVDSICQKVNLPLLRLLHQFFSVYHNAMETQMELQGRATLHNANDWRFKTRKKTTSSSGSDNHAEEFNEKQIVCDALSLDTDKASRTASPQPSEAVASVSHQASESGFGNILRKHQSFASRFRASTRKYANLDERVESPDSANLSQTIVEIETVPTHLADKAKDKTPRCWKTMYYLMDLYATMPETKTIANRSPVGVAATASDSGKREDKYEPLKETINEADEQPFTSQASTSQRAKSFKRNLVIKERVPIVVLGVVKIRRVKLKASLSGLKLEAELTSLQASHTHKEKIRGPSKRWTESSATGHLGKARVVLLEEMFPNQQIVVKADVGKSQALFSGYFGKSKEKNSAFINIGHVNVDIPQHPVVLHGMMTRSSKQLSTTLHELRTPRPPILRHMRTSEDVEVNSPRSPRPSFEGVISAKHLIPQNPKPKLLHPIVVHFTIILDGLVIGASLLPSLQAHYQMDQITSIGVTGSRAKFTVDLPMHHLSFATKVPLSEANLPSSASIDLPELNLSAEYIQPQNNHYGANNSDPPLVDGAVLRQGSYLSAIAHLGSFEHSLTTDLLNHLVLVQKVFMKEINEVVQKMAGGDKPVRWWSDNGGKESASISPVQLLYSIQLRLKGIQITATTPTYSAVRLETGCLELQLSNRVKNLSGSAGKNKDSAAKLFGKAHVELNLSLGQIVKNPLFEEAESEFQQVAYFKTKIQLRNALQDEMVSNSGTDDKEAVFIALHRPLVYVQPVALDRAVFVWLNYKNAYEYWNEQRSTLNKEVLTATQQVIEKVPPIAHLGSHSISMLFLQLTVDDLGICLPLTPHASVIGRQTCDTEHPAACVVTLETTSISACSSGSLVSKGNFQGLCIRFADEFETSLDDWKPDSNDASIMNLCVVSEGTYEVCSRTISHHSPEVAKWILNVQWEMDGVSIHVDTNIGKHLSAMAQTLTSLAGTQEPVGEEWEERRKMEQGSMNRKTRDFVDGLPSFVFDHEMDSRKRSRMIEREMNEQAKIVNDLQLLGASHSTIEQETRRLQELEAACFNDFRREVIKRLRKQSVKASGLKEKFGLTSSREKAFMVTPTPTPDRNYGNLPGGIFLSPTTSSPATSPGHGHTRTISLDSAQVTFDPESNMQKELSLVDKWPSADTMDSNLGGYVNIASFPYNSTDAAASIVSTPITTTSDSSPLSNNTPSDMDQMHFTRSISMANENEGLFHPEPSTGNNHPQHQRLLSGIPLKQAVSEPNIDFELDVKVFINSGKCVLHTKDFREEREILGERSFSNSTFEFPMSPGHRKKGSNSTSRVNTSTGKLKFTSASAPTQVADFTVFLIPGLDVKVSYNSRTDLEESNSGQNKTFHPIFEKRFLSRQQESDNRKHGMKKGSLFAWLTLQGIPEEAVITPHLLDFLEKALEPIPIPVATEKVAQPSLGVGPNKMESDYQNTFASSFVASTSSAYGSFPVDVVVYLRIQPSTLRFSCLPISRVECLLRLPSVDLVISTKRAENELDVDFKTEFSNFKSKGIAELYLTHAAVGGLSITACLADFFIYVFHPYGGKKSGSAPSSANAKDMNGESASSTGSSGRRDAFSVQLEFVKVNISRSRKITPALEPGSWLSPDKCASSGGAVIRFSTICDVGSASFKYDMRRLSEILAFPKAWYRRSIVRRLFLGEQSLTLVSSDQEDSCSSVGSPRSPEDASKESVFNLSTISLDKSMPLNESSVERNSINALVTPSRGYNRSNQSTAEQRKLTLDLPHTKRHSRTASAPSSPMNDTFAKPSNVTSPMPPTGKSGSTWETLVLFAVNLSKLNIHMNMGNVMGNTVWTTHGLQSQGRLSIGSTGHKNMLISVGLGGSSLDAKGGIVGGIIELSQVHTLLNIKEDPGLEPDHSVQMKIYALESRLDYMGTTVLMGRVSSLNVTLRDEWRVHNIPTKSETDLPTKRPALIFIHGDMEWDQLQLMLSRSTTPDLLKMNIKLEEFFAQQFQSSKRMLSSLQPSANYKSMQSTPTVNKKPISEKSNRHSSHRRHHRKSLGSMKRGRPSISGGRSPENKRVGEEKRHHRHWQNILAKASGLKLPTLENPLPPHGTILGGSMELHGMNISLACFHGVNFRAKSWALFSLKEPRISFATEAQDIVNQETKSLDTHIVQNLSFTLGHNITEHTRHRNMATVCRISKNFVFPPQFRSMQDWFHYAFTTSDIDEVDRFPGLERDRRDSVTQDRASQMRHSPKAQEANHTMEMIFALPSLQLHLKTEHLQMQPTSGNIPQPDSKPIVECSFITEFEDHIFVAVDAEAFFFLHDLITSYVKEKDRGVPTATSVNKPEKTEANVSSPKDGEARFVVTDPTETLQKDWRSYQCKTWHLEPTVRLMSWAGKRIEPYGVDYILNKLGFSHARITIPKWMQRGAMDPLDKVLAVLMGKTINALKDERDEKNGDPN